MKNLRLTSVTIRNQEDADSPENLYALPLGKEGSLKSTTLSVRDEDSINKAGISDQFEIGAKHNARFMVKHLNSNHPACKSLVEMLTGSTIVDGTPASGKVVQTVTSSTSLNRTSKKFTIDANFVDMRTNDAGTIKISNMIPKVESEINLKTEFSDIPIEFDSSDLTVCVMTITVDAIA